jgi:hypothetical protein
MSGSAVSLDELEITYRRVSRALYRAQEDALDFMAEDIFAALEREQTVVDAAFFILIFGQIEARINELATSRLSRPAQRATIRDVGFQRRLDMALPGAEHDLVRREIEAWYGRRNRVAHGETAAAEFDLSQIFRRARELDTAIAQANTKSPMS